MTKTELVIVVARLKSGLVEKEIEVLVSKPPGLIDAATKAWLVEICDTLTAEFVGNVAYLTGNK
jgi:hypothetical protein